MLYKSILYFFGGFMKENKKLKLKNLNFYIIDENYINYISKFDKHIA